MPTPFGVDRVLPGFGLVSWHLRGLHGPTTIFTQSFNSRVICLTQKGSDASPRISRTDIPLAVNPLKGVTLHVSFLDRFRQ
jgi:hypothetical protein